MPIYTFVCLACDYTKERNVPMDKRDEQFCHECGNRLKRAIDRPGLVWAPTAGGYR